MRVVIALLVMILPVLAQAQPVPQPPVPVDLDLRPASCPNPYNARARGVLPAAVLGSADLDVTTIDFSTVRLHGIAPLRWSIEDVSAPSDAAPPAAPNLLLNPGFESPDASTGDVFGTADWEGFNDRFTSARAARSGTQSLKIFGPFFPGGGAGAGQSVPASPGETYRLSAWALSLSSDPIDPSNFAVVRIEFWDAWGNLILFDASPWITSSLPLDTWFPFSVEATAPFGTAFVRAVLVHVQLETVTGGAIFFDDARLVLVSDDVDCACTEAGPDGYPDLTLKFANQELVAALGPLDRGEVVPLTLGGQLLDGTAFAGVDCMIVRGPRPDEMADDIAPAPGIDPIDDQDEGSDDLGGGSGGGIHPQGSPGDATRPIRFEVPEASAVRLAVYDIRGRRVATLVDGFVGSGSHVATWDASGRPSGIYFIRMETTNRVVTSRFVVLR